MTALGSSPARSGPVTGGSLSLVDSAGDGRRADVPPRDASPETDPRIPPAGEGQSAGSRMGAFIELTKPGITVFVTVTAAASYVLAAAPSVSLALLFHVCLGTGLATAGALALNQYLEREPDALMIRTRTRPIPSGRMAPETARWFGLVLIAAGVGHLLYWVGIVPAAITVFSAVLYDAVYTPMKRHSPLATPVGAVPGALPVLIGWTAHSGTVDARGVALFGILFLWQLIHVLALAWNLKEDYERAGFQLIPPGSSRLISVFMVGYAAALLPVSLVPSALDMTGLAYAVGAGLLGIGMVAVTTAFLLKPTRQRCRRVFFGSLLYHPILLGLMVAGAF